ncbi:hypothetical protein [Rhizobium laguerreae]|uniref:hypothetical protein n=1 Tax=Rhizobium laguerreae TaxID=1076926 RepID=UPI0028B24109|nr:hypothetical protein [Rhizobium laguerreae]
MFQKVPDSEGRSIVIDLVGKFPLNQQAQFFVEKAKAAIEGAGFGLQFRLLRQIERTGAAPFRSSQRPLPWKAVIDQTPQRPMPWCPDMFP